MIDLDTFAVVVNREKVKLLRSIPIKLISLYIMFTLLISFFGPMKYYNYDKTEVALYILAFLICLWFGYLLAYKSKRNIGKTKSSLGTTKLYNKLIEKPSIKPFLILAIKIALISIILEFSELLIKNPSVFSLSKIASNYLDIRNELSSNNSYSFALIFRFFTGFFRNIAIILGMYYWKELQKKYKVYLIVYTVLLVMVNVIAYGTQKFLGDLTIYGVIIGSIKMIGVERAKKRKIVRYCFILLVVVFISFSIIQVQRYSYLGINASNYSMRSDGSSYYDLDHIVFKIFGTNFGFGVATLLSGYISAGYYGLSLSLKLPFKWTYGFGSSYVMSTFLNRFLGLPNLYEMTYINRMTETFGRNGLRTWNTIFPWLASDLTYFGALLFFIPVGYIWSKSWYEIIKYKNPVSIVLFATITLGLVFVPANNQLFNGIDSYLSTISIVLFWMFNHKKYNHETKSYTNK